MRIMPLFTEKTVVFINTLSVNVGQLVSWLSLLMIGSIVYEVVARKLFNSPTDWAHESTTMLYGTFCIIGGVWTLRNKDHVRTEVVYQMLPVKVQIACDVLVGLLVLSMLVILCVGSSIFAIDSWAAQEVSAKSTWGVPIYPFKTVVPFASALMALQQIAHLITDVSRLFDKHRGSDDFCIED